MNIEKLKPWNWFKHEDDANNQIPVNKGHESVENSPIGQPLTTPKRQTLGHFMQLHQEIDRLFDDMWRSFDIHSNSRLLRPSSIFGSSILNQPLLGDYRAELDVSGSDTEYEISIDLPGLDQDDIQIDLSGNTLTIKGKKEEKNETQEKQYYRMERSVGSFQRTLSLPEDADHDDISANMKNGLLVIQIPRKALPKDDVKRIAISS